MATKRRPAAVLPTITERQKAFGTALSQARAAKGMTQTELAAACGIAQPTISTWETGGRPPETPELTFKLEEVLGANPGALSKHLGYLPNDAVAVVCSFYEALDEDLAIPAAARAAIRSLYEQLVGPAPRSRH